MEAWQSFVASLSSSRITHNLHYVKRGADVKAGDFSPVFSLRLRNLSLFSYGSMSAMHQPAFDLFGEIPVLESDLVAWVAAVAPRWLEPPRMFALYVRNYDVAGKVRAAKLAGLFEQITDRPARAYHARLSLAAIV